MQFNGEASSYPGKYLMDSRDNPALASPVKQVTGEAFRFEVQYSVVKDRLDVPAVTLTVGAG